MQSNSASPYSHGDSSSGAVLVVLEDETGAVVAVRGQVDPVTDIAGAGVTTPAATPDARRGVVLRFPSELTHLVSTITALTAVPEAASNRLGSTARSRAAGPSMVVTRPVLDAALSFVVTLAKAAVVGADGVSITLRRHGRLDTVAASDDVVVEMDREQYDGGEGPALDATDGRRVHVKSLDGETRWPVFVPKARARGVRTILSTPMVTADRPIGALNVYARTAVSFTREEAGWAELFAAEAAAVVAAAGPDEPDEPGGQRLREALQAREAIAQAQGVIMHRDRVSAYAAYEVLRDTSRRTHLPLRDVAAEFVASTRDGAAARVDSTGKEGASGHPEEIAVGSAVRMAAFLTDVVRSAPPTLESSPRQPDGTIYLTLAGDWTGGAADTLRPLVDRVRRHRPTLVIAELSEVGVMDSAGVDALVAASESLLRAGGRLELHNPSPPVRSLLDSTDLAQVVRMAGATSARGGTDAGPAD